MTIYENNPDGYGMMMAGKKGLVYHKDVKDFDDFWKYWRDMDRDVPRAIHFRRKTHGLINKENCHPFFPNGSVGFMHNGIIQVEEVHKDMNDTYNFMMLKMKPFIDKYPDIVEDKLFYKLIEEITGNSRLLFLTANGTFHMTNEKAWESRYGAMFSNPGALTKRTSNTTGARTNYSYPQHGHNHNHYHSLRDDTTTANDDAGTLEEIQEALRESGVVDPMGPWADDDYSVGVSRHSSGAINRSGEVCPVPPLLRIYDDRLPYGRAAAQEDIDTLFEEAQRIIEEDEARDAADEDANYLENMQTTHTGVSRTNLRVVDTTPTVERVAEGTFEEAGADLVGNFQACADACDTGGVPSKEKGEPEVDAIGEVHDSEDVDDDASDDMEKYLTPSEFANMTEQEIVDWADENPHGAATAILILTGRV